MTTARCPACGASTVDGAPWCTLCYTDLRAPAPAPAAEPVVQVPVPAGAPQPSPAQALSPHPTALDLLDVALDAPVSVAADAARGPATWPCTACGTSVALEHDSCPQCLTPFLAGAQPALELELPILGALRPLTASKTSRIWFVVGGALVLTAVLVLGLTLVGLLL